MGRKRIVLLNTVSSFAYEIVAMAAGFIIPRLMLSAFGSEVNGLVSSIAQFLGFISFCEAGVGAVVKANLYQPLAENDVFSISCVVKSAQKFFRIVAIILVIYTGVLLCVYPVMVKDSFGFLYTGLLILIISVSFFAQYYFGITNRLLLAAHQRGYIVSFVAIITVVLNTIACAVLIRCGFGVHVIKLASSSLFVLQPIILFLYVRRHYSIDSKVQYSEEPIKQKWNGFAQHLATIMQNNISVVVLTICSTLSNVSIYSIYILVINGIRQLVNTITSGITPALGDLVAKGDDKQVNSVFGFFEWLMHTISVLLFVLSAVLIVPFVMVYTQGITDANYNVPLFAILISLCGLVRCVQLPYNMMIQVACHFKQTQWAVYLEPLVNIVVSVCMVWKWGLAGIAIGMLVSLIYRLLYMVNYLKKNIVRRRLSYFAKQIMVDVVCGVCLYAVSCLFVCEVDGFVQWAIMAAKCTLVAVLIVITANALFYRDYVKRIFLIVKQRKS